MPKRDGTSLPIGGYDSAYRIQTRQAEALARSCPSQGTSPLLGRFTIKDYLGIQPIYLGKLIRVRIASKLASPTFLQIASESDIFRRQIEEVCATTVGNWGISASNLKEIRSPLPQSRIVTKGGPVRSAGGKSRHYGRYLPPSARCIVGRGTRAGRYGRIRGCRMSF